MQNDGSSAGDENIIPFQPRQAEPNPPLLNVPPFTSILLILLVVIQLGISLLPPPTQFWVMEHFGLVAARYTGGMPSGWSAFAGPVTYAFIHGGWTHLIMNGLMLIAFGSGLERWIGWKRLAVFMLACSLCAAAAQVAADPFSSDPAIGFSGAESGMFAAAIVMLREETGLRFGRYGYLPIIAIWIASAVIFGFIGGPHGETVAWAAHIGGFLAGFVVLKPVLRLKV